MKLTPTSSYSDHFDISRFELTFRINLFMTIVLPMLAIVFYVLDQPVFYPTALGTVIVTTLFFVMMKTRKFEIAAFTLSILGVIISAYTLLNYKEEYHFVDPLWMLIFILFTYFSLGKVWGHIMLFCSFAVIVFYVLFYANESLASKPVLTDGQLYALAINSVFCGLIIAYLINQFLKRNAYAVSSYRSLTRELQLKNELVEQQNQEKTAMLKEIHHRVKNNLQVITSLLRLQARDMDDTTATEHFKGAVDRIAAMALIHNKMYQSTEIDRINLKAYLETLSDNILKSYTVQIPITSNFDVRIEYAPSNTIVPIALLFNELISNSLKHAFRNKNTGTITIQISDTLDGTLTIVYADDGDWLPPVKEDSFGLELIDTLTEQLNGSFDRSIEDGTVYTFRLHPKI